MYGYHRPHIFRVCIGYLATSKVEWFAGLERISVSYIHKSALEVGRMTCLLAIAMPVVSVSKLTHGMDEPCSIGRSPEEISMGLDAVEASRSPIAGGRCQWKTRIERVLSIATIDRVVIRV